VINDASGAAPAEQERTQSTLDRSTVDSAGHDPATSLELVQLYQELTFDRLNPPVDVDMDEWVKPVLTAMIDEGRLSALSPSRRAFERDEGVAIKGTEIEAPAPTEAPKKVLRVIEEKTFLDVTVVDTDGNPIQGIPYKLQLPNGLTEEGRLGSDGHLEKRNIDPGTARLTLLGSKAEPIEVSDIPDEEEVSFVEIALLDDNDAPVAGQRYEVTLPDGSVRSGTLDEKGFAFISEVPLGNCKVSFPDLDADAWSVA
jgi:hypothetical protein